LFSAIDELYLEGLGIEVGFLRLVERVICSLEQIM
jgi:hypothetical protein